VLRTTPRIVLVSASPRRRTLIERLGLPVLSTSQDVDESPYVGEEPVALARRLALAKVHACDCSGFLVAGDTVVVSPDGSTMIGKPGDAADADSMLRLLRGRWHQVISAVAVRDTESDRDFVDHAVTTVQMRSYRDAEIAEYVASGLPLDKAGAYGIQDESFKPVAAIDGCYFSVVGLPLCTVARLLGQAGVVVPVSPYSRPDCDCVGEASLHQSGDLHSTS